MLRVLAIVFAIVLVLSLAPMLSVVVVTLVANTAGCTLHEGYANPCVILGIDWGGALYSGFVLGWMMLLTMPFAALAVLGLAVLGVIWLVARLLRRG